MKILHIITGLTQGGAESALYRLTTYEQDNSIEHIIVSLVDLGVYGHQFQQKGIQVHMIGMPRGIPTFKGLVKLFYLIKNVNPNIIQTWMYHSDLIGGIIAKLAGYNNIIWGIVHFNLEKDVTNYSTRCTAKLCAILSNYIPKKIVSCSESSTLVHIKIGYSASKFIYIPLGFDTNQLNRDDNSGMILRNKWKLQNNTIIFGCLGRWNPQKDHNNLLNAFSIVKKIYPNVYCILGGREIDKDNLDLKKLIDASDSIKDNILLEGVIDKIPSFMNAIDIHILPSIGEAFPNVVAEAMSCETACIVTDVGDASKIVDKFGWVVPPGNSDILASAMTEAINLMNDKIKWEELRKKSRIRICENYSMDRMLSKYRSTWTAVYKNSLNLN
jgi:glycosyltransferase involved in cell wall biosynthesis